jgi:hypothetical protein
MRDPFMIGSLSQTSPAIEFEPAGSRRDAENRLSVDFSPHVGVRSRIGSAETNPTGHHSLSLIVADERRACNKNEVKREDLRATGEPAD